MTVPRFVLLLSGLCLLLVTTAHAEVEDLLDDLDASLNAHTADGNFAVRFSGRLDTEAYLLQQPAPGNLYTNHDFLFNPRLSLYLDAQLGPQLYLFVESRFDRGYDPTDADLTARLDQYALRWTPWEQGWFNVQVGKFGTVVGNWASRYDSWTNPFVTDPLVYANVTHIYDSEVPPDRFDFSGPLDEEKYDYNPVIWGANDASGVSIFGSLGKFDYAAEMKNSGLSSRPEAWDVTQVGFSHPTYSARLGFRPDEAWNLGISGSVGPYFLDAVAPDLPKGKGIDDYRQITFGQDASYEWHHWQLWAEVFESRFQVPLVGNADTLSYYVEAKYKFTPQLFGALRWNQQLFSGVPNEDGGKSPWGADIWSIDAAVTYRFTPHIQMKLQYSFIRQQLAGQPEENLLAAQFTVRF